VKFSSPDLARAAQAAWRFYEGSDIPSAAAEMYWRLLILDASRTWSDDVDAGVRPTDGIYEIVVREASRIRGKTLGRLWSAAEDWASRPGDLLLSFRLRRVKQRLLIPSPGPTAGASPVTAQAAFDRLMRDLVAPALHDLGFTGKGPRWFAYRSGDYEATFSTQKSRYSTKEEVEFWVHLTAVHLPTKSVYWTMQLHALVPGSFSRWTVRADSPAEPTAEHLLGVFRHYGWPAIQAALDSPGYPPDPGATWPRAFEPEPGPAARGATGPNLGPLTWPLRRTGERDDPSPPVRSAAAGALRPLAEQPQVYAAFRAAADQDEDHEVRWGARYALRLADLAGQPGMQ
jgi:hypothetical protein